MKLVHLISMAFREVKASRSRNLISAFGIAFGVTTLLVVVGLGLGARRWVLKEVVRELPVNMVEVVPKQLDMGLFKLGAGAVFGGPKLDDVLVERLEALPEVERVFPKLEIDLPLGARGGQRFFKRSIYSDIFIEGVPLELLEPELGAGFAIPPEVIPVVISSQLIEIFNRSVAPNLGLPALTGETLKGLRFELQFGRSVMMGTTGAMRVGTEPAQIVGVSRYAMPVGATVPLQVAKRIVRQYGGDGRDTEYKSLILRAAHAADVPAIVRQVEQMGFDIDNTAKRTADVMTTITWLASSVGFLVLALAGLNIAHSFFAALTERRRELAIFRAVGAKRSDLIMFVLAQATTVGVVGGATGVAGAYTARIVLDGAASRWLPDFPFKPDSFFFIPASVAIGGMIAACLAAGLGALGPAIWAARAPIHESLSE